MDIKQQHQKATERLAALGTKLEQLREKAVRQRTKIEQRWLKDMRQLKGRYEPELEQSLREENRSQLFRNKTRPKCRVAVSQLSRMLFPNDDENWSIAPTPIPDAGIPEDNIKQVSEAVKAAAEGMSKQIKDDLVEADYVKANRQVIKDSVHIGTGILKAPVVVNRVRKAWVIDEQTGLHILQVVPDISVGVDRVDPWNFYPDMSATCIDDAEYIFEKHTWTKRKLKEFSQTEGVILSSVQALVEEEQTVRYESSDNFNRLREINGLDAVTSSNLYHVWEYHGSISVKDLATCGCEINDKDPLEEYQAIVWLAGGKVLKAVLNPMETEENPYSVFCWEEDETCVFGFGIPYLMRHPQKGSNAAWRMMFDNSGISAMPQVVRDDSVIEPVDGDWTLKAGKQWRKTKASKQVPVGNVFELYDIPSNQPMLAGLLQLTEQAVDEEVNIPLIAQGEQGTGTTKTASGMGILANNASAVFEHPVKNFDDNITKPVIKRFYNWHMQNNVDQSIKGDFQIQARGSSALLVREIQQQMYMQLLQLAQTDPEFRAKVDFDKLVPEVMKSMRAGGMIREEVQEGPSQAPDPQEQAAMLDMQIKQQTLQLKQQELALKAEIEQKKLEQERELALYRLAADKEMKVTELAEKVGIEQARIKAQRDIAGVNSLMKQQEISQREISRHGY